MDANSATILSQGLIGVGPVDNATFDGLTELQTLFVAAHTWALATATPLTLVAGSELTVLATGPFATPAALFAMKLHAIQDRRSTSRPERRRVTRSISTACYFSSMPAAPSALSSRRRPIRSAEPYAPPPSGS